MKVDKGDISPSMLLALRALAAGYVIYADESGQEASLSKLEADGSHSASPLNWFTFTNLLALGLVGLQAVSRDFNRYGFTDKGRQVYSEVRDDSN